MIKIQREDIDIQKHLDMVRAPNSGGIVTFLGSVRDNAKGRQIAKINIEVYESMALTQLKAIRAETLKKFKVNEVVVVHRYGELDVGDNIVFIAVSAEHRGEAFKACIYVIDELKQRVPIWKKETTPGGDFWVDSEQVE